jgi:hypothetical protein
MKDYSEQNAVRKTLMERANQLESLIREKSKSPEKMYAALIKTFRRIWESIPAPEVHVKINQAKWEEVSFMSGLRGVKTGKRGWTINLPIEGGKNFCFIIWPNQRTGRWIIAHNGFSNTLRRFGVLSYDQKVTENISKLVDPMIWRTRTGRSRSARQSHPSLEIAKGLVEEFLLKVGLLEPIGNVEDMIDIYNYDS